LSDSGNKPGHERDARKEDSWEFGDPYEYFMGRWSRLVARQFIDWLSPPSGCSWLDIGCGSGALSEAIINNSKPAGVTAIDQSHGFVREVQRRLGNLVQSRVGNALSLPVPDASVQFAVSGLVLNFISEPIKALSEMKRVTFPGGTVAVYVWDYSSKMEFLSRFWDEDVTLDSKASASHEGNRFPNSTAEALSGLFDSAGFLDIESAPIDIVTQFRDFDDYWKPFLGGQGPAPTYLMSLEESDRQLLRNRLVESLPIQKDGSIRLEARAWAVKGKRARATSV
jgi:SAM-dependent methyltransferase